VKTSLVPLLLGLAAFGMVMTVTSGAGPGLDPDSMSYVGAATSFAHHGTFRVPSSSWDSDDSTSALTVWPPGFPIAMGIPIALGATTRAAARIVNASAAFVTAIVMYLLLDEAIGPAAAALAVIAVLATPAFIGVHLSVLSEPLFLASLMLVLFAMVRRRPILAGIFAAVTAMVRYAGACAPLAVVIWFFFEDAKPIRQRFKDATLAGIIPAITIAFWIVRSRRVGSDEGGIEVSVYGKLGPTLREGLHTIADWLAPGITSVVPQIIIAVAMAGAIAMGVLKYWRSTRRTRSSDNLFRAGTVLLSCYLAVLINARLFVGDAIPFDFRILSPLMLLLVVLIALSAGSVWKRSRVAISVFALWLVASAVVSEDISHEAITEGSDFASSEWRHSPTIDWIRSRAAGVALFTNWPAAVYFKTGRTSHDIPQSLDTAELREFHDILKDDNGVFVAFNEYNTDYPPSDSIAHDAGLVPIEKLSDGTVWAVSK